MRVVSFTETQNISHANNNPFISLFFFVVNTINRKDKRQYPAHEFPFTVPQIQRGDVLPRRGRSRKFLHAKERRRRRRKSVRGCKEFCRLVYQIHDAGRGKAAGRKSRGSRPRHVKYEYVSVDLYLAPPISSCILEGARELVT